MIVNITNTFKHAAKKLHSKQKDILKEQIEEIKENIEIGEMKKGDLAGVRVYKFNLTSQLMLLSYVTKEVKQKDKVITELTLLSLGPHENFYKKLKK